MSDKKTTFQNWVEENYATQSAFAEAVKNTQGNISTEFKSKNGLLKIAKYAKKLGLESVDFHGHDYGCEVKGTLKIR